MKKSIVNGKAKTVALILGSVFASVVSAATAISIDKVAQRWPWNNKVDITYTVRGEGQDIENSKFYKIVFTTEIKGSTYTIDGSSVGASANEGTHTVTWTAPLGIKSENCTMSATIMQSDLPSGDDYMIIDLSKQTDNVTYEGRFATQ